MQNGMLRRFRFKLTYSAVMREYNDDSYGAYFFDIFAKTSKEAFKKACQLVNASDIDRWYEV